MANDSDGKRDRKRDPAIIAACILGGMTVNGGLLAVLLTHALAGSPQTGNPRITSSSTPVVTRSSLISASSPATTATTQPGTGPSGTITVPSEGSTDVYVSEQLHASGTAQNVPQGNHLELFLQFKTQPPFYAAGNPETAITLNTSDGWSGTIYIGAAEPCTLWLVDLTSAEANLMNQEVSDESGGYPTLPGTVLAHVSFTAS